MKKIKIGKHLIPLWLIVVLFISGTSLGILAYYVWNTLVIPIEVKEPIEILDYPSELSLFPGETEEYNVTVQNHASVNYSVILAPSLDNITYQDSYVTFSNVIYTVVPGEQNLGVWLKVASDAPPVNTSLTIDFRREVFPYGLVGFWRFDEGRGLITFDSSEYNNHGILVNAPLWVDGKYGEALSFDGIDDYVQIPDSQSLRVQSVTLAAWVYMAQRPYQHSGDNHVAIVNKMYFVPPYPGGVGTNGYKLDFEYPSSTDDDLVFAIGDGTSQRFLVGYNSINDLTLNHWHHIVGSFDGTTAKLYIDGELKSSSDPVSYAIMNDDTPLGIGQEVTGASGHFKGLIDNVMIFDRALNPEEVGELYIDSLP